MYATNSELDRPVGASGVSEAIHSSRNRLGPQPVAPGVSYLTVVFVNVYFVTSPDGTWTLVDTGLPHSAAYVRRAAEQLFGNGARPVAIVLTHGHFDHSGAVIDLAEAWNVPVYAHRQELPYLTGKSDYPPQDPTIGGALAFLSRAFPHTGINVASIRELPEDGTIPTMPGWQWIHAPGHTAGQVSLFRESDRVLLAADAFTTMDLDSWASQVTEKKALECPPTPLTTDWAAARASVQKLADLEPVIIGAGHGIPVSGPDVPTQLRELAAQITPPVGGRYSVEPARTDDTGALVAVPPPVADPLPAYLLISAAVLTGIAVGYTLTSRKDAANGA